MTSVLTFRRKMAYFDKGVYMTLADYIETFGDYYRKPRRNVTRTMVCSDCEETVKKRVNTTRCRNCAEVRKASYDKAYGKEWRARNKTYYKHYRHSCER